MNTNLNKTGISLFELGQSLGLAPPTHGYTIAEKSPEIVTAPGVYFPIKKGRVIPLKSRQEGGTVRPKTMIEKMEEAAGITGGDDTLELPRDIYKAPYGRKESIKSGETARSWTGPRPWRKDISLLSREGGGRVSPSQFLLSYSPKIERNPYVEELLVPKKSKTESPSIPGLNKPISLFGGELTGGFYGHDGELGGNLQLEIPFSSRQEGGMVNPSLFKDEYSLGIPNPVGDEQAIGNILSRTPDTSGQSLVTAPTSLSERTYYDAHPEEKQKDYEAQLQKPLTPTPIQPNTTGLTLRDVLPLSSFAPPNFRENRRSPVFGSDQRAAYDRKWKPYNDLLKTAEGQIPVIPKAVGGVTDPSMTEDELKRFKLAFPDTISSHTPIGSTVPLASSRIPVVTSKTQPGLETFLMTEKATPETIQKEPVSDVTAETEPKGTFTSTPMTEEESKQALTRFKTSPRNLTNLLTEPSGYKETFPGGRTLERPAGYKSYYDAHPEERFADMARQETRPLVDAYMKLIEKAKTRAEGFGLGMNPKTARALQVSSTQELPVLAQGLEKLISTKEVLPEKYYSDILGEGTRITPHLVKTAGGQYVYSIPPRGINPPGIVPAGIEGETDASEWKMFEEAGRRKGLTREQMLEEWDKKQIERVGKKAEVTINAQTGGGTGFSNWDEATQRQSFENFIINNQKPTFAWRDAKSRNAWEEGFNKYLIEKGKTAESVGETRFYRDAQKSALRRNEEYYGATSRFVKNIENLSDQFMKLRKQYGVNFGKLVNTAINNLRQGIPGSGELANLQQYLTSISLEVAKVESGELGIQAATESQQKLWARIHNLNFNEEDIEKVLEASKTLGRTRIKNIREVGDEFRRSLGGKEVEAEKTSTESENRRVINGVTYFKKDGDWYKE